MKTRNKRLTRREKVFLAQIETLQNSTERNYADIRSLQAKLQEKDRLLQQRIDTSMIDARTKLASSLGQLVEATSKAVMFIVAKESL